MNFICVDFQEVFCISMEEENRSIRKVGRNNRLGNPVFGLSGRGGEKATLGAA